MAKSILFVLFVLCCFAFHATAEETCKDDDKLSSALNSIISALVTKEVAQHVGKLDKEQDVKLDQVQRQITTLANEVQEARKEVAQHVDRLIKELLEEKKQVTNLATLANKVQEARTKVAQDLNRMDKELLENKKQVANLANEVQESRKEVVQLVGRMDKELLEEKKQVQRLSDELNKVHNQRFFVTTQKWDARLQAGHPYLHHGFQHHNDDKHWRSFEFSCPVTDSSTWVSFGHTTVFCSLTPAPGLTELSHFEYMSSQTHHYALGPVNKQEMQNKWHWKHMAAVWVKIEKYFE